LPTAFEIEISTLLRDLKDPALVAEDLFRRWSMKLLSDDEARDCASFAVASGLYPAFFQKMQLLLQEDAPLPWAAFSEAVGRAKIKPTQAQLVAIVEGAESQNLLSDLLRSYQLDLWSRIFIEKRAALEKNRLVEREAKKDELKDQLQFMRAQRLVEQEEIVFDKIEALFPEEPEIQEARKELDVRKAQGIVAQSNRGIEHDPARELEWKLSQLTPDESSAKDLMVARAIEIAKKTPSSAYDLSLALHSMDFHSAALQLIEFAPKSYASDWLKLELMIQARQWATALDEAGRLASEYASEPEATFASAYAKARALKGLGRKNDAVEILRGLVRIRPQYKSAHSLLLDWGGDE
jgi:hypothetical protein